MARNVTLTISLPADTAQALRGRMATERASRMQPHDVTLEDFATLAIGRYLRAGPDAPALRLPLGPGLLALAQYIHGECIAREWAPEGYELEAFLLDAIHERLALILDNWIGDWDPREVRMLDALEEGHALDGDTDGPRRRLVR